MIKEALAVKFAGTRPFCFPKPSHISRSYCIGENDNENGMVFYGRLQLLRCYLTKECLSLNTGGNYKIIVLSVLWYDPLEDAFKFLLPLESDNGTGGSKKPLLFLSPPPFLGGISRMYIGA